MKKLKFYERSISDFLLAVGPSALLIFVALFVSYHYLDPAPPKHLIISTGDGEGDYQLYADQYKEMMKKDGIELETMPSKGAWENLKRLEDPHSNVDAGFVQDGLGSRQKAPHVTSLGSLYYEPLWVFYRGRTEVNRLAQLAGKRIAIGEKGGSTHTMSKKLLAASGIDEKNASLIEVPPDQATESLRKGDVDVAIYIATPRDANVDSLLRDKKIKLMSFDQAEATSRQFPYLHHLVLPHGAIDLKENLPPHDVDLVAPTATLLVRQGLHPALVYLLLRTAARIHGRPDLLELRHEFPTDKNYVFPLNEQAKEFYKSGIPFWQRHLPFWMATIVNRFIFLVVPLFAVVIPLVKLIPRIFQWRVKSRIYQRYGELKFLETRVRTERARSKYQEYLDQLDKIEERVNHMKIPLGFTDYTYDLREHIHFVRERIDMLLKTEKSGT